MIRFATRNRFILGVVLAALVFASLDAAPAAAQTPGPCGALPFHVVQANENLYRIARGYNTTWNSLALLNRLTNPNRILVGQVLCLPEGSIAAFPGPYLPPTTGGNPPVPTQPPAPGAYFPPPGVYPAIELSTYVAAPGQVVNIFGSQFPGGRTVEIFVYPREAQEPTTPTATTTTALDGSLAVALTIPPVTGSRIRILVREPQTRYFAFNTFTNSAP